MIKRGDKVKRIGMIHTVKPMFLNFGAQIEKEIDDVTLFHIIDDHLVDSIREAGGIQAKHLKILSHMIQVLENYELDYIASSCSSLSDALDQLQPFCEVPLLKMDTPMLEKAIELGSEIIVLATAPTTITPTVNQLNQLAKAAGKKINVNAICLPEAGSLLFGGKLDEFVDYLIQKVETIEHKSIIVLAQGAMACAKTPLEDKFNIPVLESPTLFIENLKKILGSV